MNRADDIRKRSSGAVHAGKRALGWSDEIYRTFLFGATGKTSATDCTNEELAMILDGMRMLGFGRKDGEERERATQLSKARALWNALAATGALRDPSDTAFRSYIRRMTKKDRAEWCTPQDLIRVIEGLKGWLAREQAKASEKSQGAHG